VAQAHTISTLKETFGFPFRSPDWQGRFLVGSALLILSFVIPILPAIFVYGYVLDVMRQAIEGRPLSMPAWQDWGRFWKDGWRVFLVGLVFLAPGVALLCGGTALYFAGSLSLPFLQSSSGEPSAAGLTFFLLSFTIFFVSLFAGSLLAVLGTIPFPFAAAHLTAQDSLGAAFRTGEWWPALRRSKAEYFIAWVIVFGLFGIAYMATILAYYSLILCFLVPVLAAPLGFYASLVAGALFGETYREGIATRSASRRVARKKAR
jgi:hypothetical protein